MSVQNPIARVKRWSLVGMEGMWAKMFDPPTASPETPDFVEPTNPVPEVMATAGYLGGVATPHTVERDLMHGLNMPTWDNRPKGMNFFLIREANNPLAVGTFPGPTVRAPRGVVFHAHTAGHGPPPHTIHWHGLEPTPINDGVGHCSMEIGNYTYQFQPNFIGSYFYHCHRNTVQHFEFGLYGFFVVEPPDAYFATQALSVPVGHCRDGFRRTACNLTKVSDGYGNFSDMSAFFGRFNANLLTAADPEANNATLDPSLKFATDPHAMTVAYDVEALWVVDDRDSRWSDLAPSAFATYPQFGDTPGVNDKFDLRAGVDGFFAFNDYHPDYWYVTGVPVPEHTVANGGTGVGTIPEGITIPPELNSGVSGTQVPVRIKVGQTLLIRALDAAYACVEWTFPVDIVVIAWDGRALGVPPYGQYNHAYRVPANTPFRASVARRFDALVKAEAEIDAFARVKFINTRGEHGGTNNMNFDVLPFVEPDPTVARATAGPDEVLMEVRIPFKIVPADAADPAPATGAVAGTVTVGGAPAAGVSVTVAAVSLGGSATQTVVTDAQGKFSVTGLTDGMVEITPATGGATFTPPVSRAMISGGQTATADFTATSSVGTVTLTVDPASPQGAGTQVVLTAAATGTGPFTYTFRVRNVALPGNGVVTKTAALTTPTWTWDTTGLAPATYSLDVSVAPVGATSAAAEVGSAPVDFVIDPPAAASVDLSASVPSPQAPGTPVTLSATVTPAGSYTYKFQVTADGGTTWTTLQDFAAASSLVWNTAAVPQATGTYKFQVTARPAGATTSVSDITADKNFVVATQQGPLTITLTADPAAPQSPGAAVNITATGAGGGGTYQYEIKIGGKKVLAKTAPTAAPGVYAWDTSTYAVGTYLVTASAWTAGSKKPVKEDLTYTLSPGTVTVTTQTAGADVTATAAAPDIAAPLFEFWIVSAAGKKKKIQKFSTAATVTIPPALAVAGTTVQVNVKASAAKGNKPQAQGSVAIM